MTKDEWLSLKPGDIIIETSSNIERTVLSVRHNRRPGHIKTRTSITLRKIGSGTTKGPNTTYNNHDDQGRWRLKTMKTSMYYSYQCLDPVCGQTEATMVDIRTNHTEPDRNLPCPLCKNTMHYMGCYLADADGYPEGRKK